jgi:CheY-like chemotaxis protein
MSAALASQYPLPAQTALARRRPRLLLAEDDDELRVVLAQVLHDLGWEVLQASNGAALADLVNGALFEHRSPPPDIIVTDVRMPGVNGLSVLEGLRDLGWNTPAVVMSSYGDDELRARVKSFAPSAFFDKPLDVALLDRTLRRLL